MSIVKDGLAIWTTPRCGSTTLHRYFRIPITPENHHKRWEVEAEQVCLLRHPCDLLVSWFLLSRVEGFKKFLREFSDDRMEQDGKLFYLWRPGDKILRTDKLTEGLSELLGKEVTLPMRLNITPYKRDWPLYYDQEALEIVEKRYPTDFEIWRTHAIV